MEGLLTYILQVNAGLLVFYLLYRISFSRDTFLRIRRLFLFTIVFFSFIYPFMSLAAWLEQRPELPALVVDYAELLTGVTFVATEVAEQPSVFTWQQLLLGIWGCGCLILLMRMFLQLGCICLLAYRGERQMWHHIRIITLKKITAPFSFFGWIFVNPADHEEKELQEIIAHESAHVRQWHSVDMLLGECLCILFWFNPIVWLLRKEIRQNLEFLADENVVASGYNRKNYQYHLLRLSHQSTAVPIVNNFNVIQLKKRIVMMNKKKTSRAGLLKYALILPVTGLLILAGNAQAVADLASRTVMQSGDQKTRVYEGRVIDENGQPLPGATVIVKNTSLGVASDEDGNFSIETQEGKTLCFSYVGKRTTELVCQNKTKLKDVVMYKQAAGLEELVVVGYTYCDQPSENSGEELYVAVEDMPRFIHGEIHSYLARLIKYPVKAQEKGITGKVFVSFVIDKNGKVTDPQIIRGVDKDLDQEALRVVKMLPDWIPGKQRGNPVDVLYTLPISFRLESNQPQTPPGD